MTAPVHMRREIDTAADYARQAIELIEYQGPGWTLASHDIREALGKRAQLWWTTVKAEMKASSRVTLDADGMTWRAVQPQRTGVSR